MGPRATSRRLPRSISVNPEFAFANLLLMLHIGIFRRKNHYDREIVFHISTCEIGNFQFVNPLQSRSWPAGRPALKGFSSFKHIVLYSILRCVLRLAKGRGALLVRLPGIGITDHPAPTVLNLA
jgi:hypothetical protein